MENATNCVFCRAEFNYNTGLEDGPSRQVEQEISNLNDESNKRIDMLNQLLNPKSNCENSALKSQIIRECLAQSKRKNRTDCIKEDNLQEKKKKKKFSISSFNHATFLSVSRSIIGKHSTSKANNYREMLYRVLQSESKLPIIHVSILDSTISKLAKEHCKPVPRGLTSEQLKVIEDQKRHAKNQLRQDLNRHFAETNADKPFAMCKRIIGVNPRCSLKQMVFDTEVLDPGNCICYYQIPPSLLDQGAQNLSTTSLFSYRKLSRVKSDYKVVGFFSKEDFGLLILSSSSKTEAHILKKFSNQSHLSKNYNKRTILADFVANSNVLVLYWVEGTNHSLSTFIVDPTGKPVIRPLRTFQLASTGRYQQQDFASHDPILLKLCLYSDGDKALALDKTNHFVFIDLKFDKMNHNAIPLLPDIERNSLWMRTVKKNLVLMIFKQQGIWQLSCNFLSVSGRLGKSLLDGLGRQQLPFPLNHPSFQLAEFRNCTLLCLDGNHLHKLDLMISQRSSSLYLDFEDNYGTNQADANGSTDILEILPNCVRKFAISQCHDCLPVVTKRRKFQIISPQNISLVNTVVNAAISKLKSDGFLPDSFSFSSTSNYHEHHVDRSVDLSQFILRWIEVVPIQVARIDAGTLLPLFDGVSSSDWLQTEQGNGLTAQEIAKSIRFGTLELIFNAFPFLAVNVVVAAGSQSSGKSSFLNHMFNHFFDVAGSRTTQGVWFGVRVFEGCIWVAIDLEGLGSFERTSQEDCYQSLFGAALAKSFVLRTTHHFDRFIESCLNSWSEAGTVLADGDDLFKGVLVMTPRDVSFNASMEVIQDFTDHLNPIWDNSLRETSNGQVHALSIFSDTSVVPWPSYACFPDYSREVGESLHELVSQKARFDSPFSFKQTSTLLLAKLFVKDFSSLSETVLRQKIQQIESSLNNLIATGLVSSLESKSDTSVADLLNNWLTHASSEDDYPNITTLQLSAVVSANQATRLKSIHCHIGENSILAITDYNDVGLVIDVPSSLSDHAPDCRRLIFDRLASFFVDNILSPKKVRDKELFDSFLNAIITRRAECVKDWFQLRTSNHSKEKVFSRMANEIRSKFNSLRNTYRLCRGRCAHIGENQTSSCNLGCFLLADHVGDCSCLGNHACEDYCSLCPDEQCCLGAGHESECLCPAGHVCGQSCHFSSLLGCAGSCTQQKNHKGDCRCSIPFESHLCGQECSLDGCSDRCQEPHHVPHDRHFCGTQGCPEKCPLCQSMCASVDHFHSQTGELHLCGHEHNCPQQCTKRGNCEVLTHLRLQEEVYVTSAGDQITYHLLSEQNAKRRDCGVFIPSDVLNHADPCNCAADSHYCDVKCESCGYFCMEPIDHEGPHCTTHGNMRNLRLVSSSNQVKVGSIGTFGRGDSGICLTCTNSCREFGRGHIHLVESSDERLSRVPDIQKRFQTTNYENDTEFFEVSCEAYWENFLEFDPKFQTAELDNFRKCPAKCGADHDEDAYCELELFHNPHRGELPASVPNGYVSRDGHVFSCTHYGGGNFHTFFVFDRSASMSTCDAVPTLSWINQRNRLGAVYEAIFHYAVKRVHQSPSDMFSFIEFNSSASVLSSAITLPSNPQVQLANILGSVAPSGGTSFHRGFNAAFDCCRQNLNQEHKPIFIFLSDGRDSRDYQTTRDLIRNQLHCFSETVIHTIGFGDGSGSPWLREIASLGKGQYHETTDTISLCDVFVGISAEPDRSAFV
ncbi:hypothetical protein P9112_001862 [Eukaryota sp. TZLM1-RC]